MHLPLSLSISLPLCAHFSRYCRELKKELQFFACQIHSVAVHGWLDTSRTSKLRRLKVLQQSPNRISDLDRIVNGHKLPISMMQRDMI